jgi:hypothetical protein
MAISTIERSVQIGVRSPSSGSVSGTEAALVVDATIPAVAEEMDVHILYVDNSHGQGVDSVPEVGTGASGSCQYLW